MNNHAENDLKMENVLLILLDRENSVLLEQYCSFAVAVEVSEPNTS